MSMGKKSWSFSSYMAWCPVYIFFWRQDTLDTWWSLPVQSPVASKLPKNVFTRESWESNSLSVLNQPNNSLTNRWFGFVWLLLSCCFFPLKIYISFFPKNTFFNLAHGSVDPILKTHTSCSALLSCFSFSLLLYFFLQERISKKITRFISITSTAVHLFTRMYVRVTFPHQLYFFLSYACANEHKNLTLLLLHFSWLK